MAQETIIVNLTTTGQILTGVGVISSFYVNSTSSGAFKLWNGVGRVDSGAPLGGVITPAVGFHNMDNFQTTPGVYLEGTAGSFNVSFRIKVKD